MATGERRHVVAQPKAKLVLLETQKPLFPQGVTVERYATVRSGTVYEKHIWPEGPVTWWRVEGGTVKNG